MKARKPKLTADQLRERGPTNNRKTDFAKDLHDQMWQEWIAAGRPKR